VSDNIKERLATLKTKPSKKAHIVVDTAICEQKCPHHCTTLVCPAGCYEFMDGKMTFRYEDCVECGTCLHACDQGALTWNYPDSGCGVSFNLG
jgi:ferredoxin like protein